MPPFGHTTYTVEEATQKLMQFCSYRDRSHKEVEEKLIQMKMIPQAREQIILKLMQENFLNEERFARSFVRGKFRIKKWGRIKIKQELKHRDISDPIIRLAMTEIQENQYLETLSHLAQKKFFLMKAADSFQQRKKLTDYLLRKGYEYPLVQEVIDELIT